MSDIDKEFQDALNYVKTSEGDIDFSNEVKLEIYAMFKQATQGDVDGPRPGMMDFVNRAKYDAWAKLKGTSQDDAKQRYTQTVTDLRKRYEG